ncbi:c-type cytochrome [Helicobacter burdigaliensis]|uniref:c-type cytochrome n=1 Tax=Helicobacter burdigaliensis TaxID=2315334 RepID=UPI000EF72C95|nr:cytochrome c [Helicobacter burdigaliensis]
MKKIILGFICVGMAFISLGFSKGEVKVSQYNPNNPNSPANFSSVKSSTLSSEEKKGQKIYSKWCVSCHGVNMPATNALAVAYKGTGIPALLEDRTDLSVEFVQTFVRYGKSSMPFFRKTEINDEELRLLGKYLSRNSK